MSDLGREEMNAAIKCSSNEK
uniref:Uncharacterized protein n=1 Tax=Rhizophora mucronata TaxID=61149 RepID=A0A2P2QKV0_RHIMU